MFVLAGRDISLFELVVGSLLILFSILNIVIYMRLNRDFSIKYELLRDRNFRGRRWLQRLIKGFYIIELFVPIVLILILFLEIVIRDVKSGFIVFTNGCLLLSLIYLTNSKVFYVKLLFILLLVVSAELITLYLSTDDPGELYSASSSIFFSLNGILVSLTILTKEMIYWDIRTAIKEVSKEQISKVNEDWTKLTPKIVDGGLYGWLFERANTFVPLFLYLSSLVVLGVYCYQDWYFSNRFIGAISAGGIVTLDFVTLVLSSLSEKIRSPFSMMVIIFGVRFFLFVFGHTYWFIGYCVLYVLIGTFIAYLIVEKRFPKYNVTDVVATVNAFKTPEFIFILITCELVVMIVSLYLSTDQQFKIDIIVVNGREFPFWSFGVLAIIITFVFSLYFASMRVLYRWINGIRDKVVYFFGHPVISEYHILILSTYVLVVILGIYTHLTYEASLSLTLCIFLPLLLNLVVEMGVCWQENNFYVLAQIDEYNTKERRKKTISNNNTRILSRMANKKQIKRPMDQVEREALEGIDDLHNPNNQPEISAYDLIIDENINDYEQLVDWRDPNQGIGFPQVLLFITPNDKRFLVYIALFVVLMAGLVLTSYLWCQSPVGLYLAVSIISYILQVPYYRCTKTHHDLEALELVAILAGYLLGLVYWSVNWYEVGGGLTWSVLFILLLTYLLIETLRNTKDNKKLYVTQVVQIILLMVFDVALVYVNFSSPYYYIIAIAAIFYFILALSFYYVYTTFKRAIPKWVYIAYGAVLMATFMGVIVGAFFVNSISIMTTFSIAVLTPIGALLAFGWVQFYRRHLNRFETVVIYSAYGLPAYKFNSETQQLKKDEVHLYMYFMGLMALVVYAEIVFFFFNDKITMGIYALCFFEVVGFLSFILVAMKNYYTIGSGLKELQHMISNEALAHKKIHNNEPSLASHPEQSQEGLEKRIYRETLELLLTKYMPDIDDDVNTSQKINQLREKERLIEDYHDEQQIQDGYDEIVHLNDQIVRNIEEEELFLFFWIGLIEFRLMSEKKMIMTTLLNDIQEIKSELEEAGIAFEDMESTNDLEIKYEKQLSEIRALQPQKQVIFEEILREHKYKKVSDDVKARIIDENERLQNLEREKELELKMQGDPNITFSKTNLNKMSLTKDTFMREGDFSDLDLELIQKFKEYSQTYKGLFIDSEFPAGPDSLGAKVINKVEKWDRPQRSCKVMKEADKISEAKQGNVGNCYLISTFSVLGIQNIRKALGMSFTNKQGKLVPEEWANDSEKGIYMVRFKKFSKNIFVRIDDHFPVDSNNNWVCGKSEEPQEIWPNILEKAYAKMYGSYTKIFGGKAHFVMAEFTGGFPSEFLLEEYVHNVNALWKKLLMFKDNGYLLAAGTPPGSDSNYSKLGIAKGHAYSILDVKAVESHRLIKLRNPQGSQSVEWKGGFSDDSPQMDNRMKGFLDHTSSRDGKFWMPLTDFIREFKSLYVCRQFGDGWKSFCFDNKAWDKDNSAGNQKNKGIEKNPQYAITITQKSTLFISLTQERDETSLTSVGMHKISFRLQRNQGKRLSFKDVSSEQLCTPMANPTKNITLTNEYELEEGSYPFTYTLMVFTEQPEEQGLYCLEVYCNDVKSAVVDDERFDK